jgi:hypothetical protein
MTAGEGGVERRVESFVGALERHHVSGCGKTKEKHNYH